MSGGGVYAKNVITFSNSKSSCYQLRQNISSHPSRHEEVDRLGCINHAMRALERRLLDVDAIERMDVAQQLTLFEILSRSQQVSIRNVTDSHYFATSAVHCSPFMMD